MKRLISWLLGLHGAYYALTGLWALIDLDGFNRFVGHPHPGGAFEMHSIAAMAVALGIVFILAARNVDKNLLVVLCAGLVALSVVTIELVYLPSMGWNLFWLDLVEEIVVTIVFLWYPLSHLKDLKHQVGLTR